MIWNPWKRITQMQEIITYNEVRIAGMLDMMDRDTASFMDMRNVLTGIAAEEKPTSNATVKRMAKMAREALEM